VFDSDLAAELVKAVSWVVVDDKPKQENSASSLPDEFYFHVVCFEDEELYKATREIGDNFLVTWESSAMGQVGTSYTEGRIQRYLANGDWKIMTKPVLTAEQQKQLKEFKEQVAQLDSSIKLNEQDIEHRNRLIANYKERQEVLRKKIAELEGV
jgi:hypothetical protein